jgi:Gpi18-like mannosyltransferase
MSQHAIDGIFYFILAMYSLIGAYTTFNGLESTLGNFTIAATIVTVVAFALSAAIMHHRLRHRASIALPGVVFAVALTSWPLPNSIFFTQLTPTRHQVTSSKPLI